MSSLLERCKAASAAVGSVEMAQRNLHVQAKVQERTKEWSDQRNQLAAAQGRAEWLDLVPGQVLQFADKQEELRRIAKEALARLGTVEDVSKLTDDPLWTRLLRSAAGATEALEEAVRMAWRSYVEAMGALDSPDRLQATLSMTPVNQEVLAAYRPRYAVYKRLSEQTAPRSAEDKATLQKTIADCRAELAKVERHVPKDVEEFFRAVDGFNATLSLVTPDVLRWLKDKGQLDHYLVRSTGR